MTGEQTSTELLKQFSPLNGLKRDNLAALARKVLMVITISNNTQPSVAGRCIDTCELIIGVLHQSPAKLAAQCDICEVGDRDQRETKQRPFRNRATEQGPVD